MSDFPWVQFYPSDWLAGTRGMSAAETGVYITLIAMMYERQEPIKEDIGRLARVCGSSNSAFKKALDVLVEDGKIERADGLLWNNRVGREVEKRSEKSEVARQSAKRRWGTSKEKDQQNQRAKNANAEQTQSERNANQKPETRIEKEEPKGSSKKGTRITDDWDPGPDGITYAEQKGLSSKQISIEVEKFRNYFLAAPGQKAIKVDWLATWKNWVINSQSRYSADHRGSIPVQSTMGLDVLKRRASVDRLPPTPRKASA